jgi:hypothetical protein
MLLCNSSLGRSGLMLVLAAACGGAWGCSRTRDATPLRPVSPDAVRLTAQSVTPTMPGRRVSTLLDFDTPDDVTFTAADHGGSVAADSSVLRSGKGSLSISPGTPTIAIKLATLLIGRPFPADWTLAGAHLHTDRPTYLTLSYEIAGASAVSRTVGIAPGAWTPVMIDLAALKSVAGGEIGTLRLSIDPRYAANVHVDDVMLIDNHESVLDTADVSSSGWSVKRRGLYYIVDAPTRFSFTVPTAHAEQGGWAVADACPSRVRFVSSNAPGTMTVYADGRMYYGGEFRPMGNSVADAAALAQQHVAPAEVTVPETLGRLNRSSAGDANNDGYNESRGAYQVVAAGPRVELTLAPRTPVLSRPIIEIAGLPSGPVLVHMEGRLITGAVRLGNGDVLLELPAQIQRPTLVNVRVQ